MNLDPATTFIGLVPPPSPPPKKKFNFNLTAYSNLTLYLYFCFYSNKILVCPMKHAPILLTIGGTYKKVPVEDDVSWPLFVLRDRGGWGGDDAPAADDKMHKKVPVEDDSSFCFYFHFIVLYLGLTVTCHLENGFDVVTCFYKRQNFSHAFLKSHAYFPANW